MRGLRRAFCLFVHEPDSCVHLTDAQRAHGVLVWSMIPEKTFAGMRVVTTAFGGCGWVGHRGPEGLCRPLYNCPPGWRTGPFGRHCHRAW
jgi:hypothetical protein